MNEFEWDEAKRLVNIVKHGIDFIDAVNIFDDVNRIESICTHHKEHRCQTIGIVNDIVLFVVYTDRVIRRRIISARRASRHERKAYFQKS
jgi:uncharacterized DUF497 family protein